MDNIIKFPTTTEKEYTNGTKLAKEAFTKMKATESITTDSKQLLMSTSLLFRLSSVMEGQIASCGPLSIYGSAIAGVTASVFHKESKVGGQFIQRLNNILTAVSIFHQK